MTAELGQAEKSPVAVLTQGGSNSLKGADGDGDAAAVVAVADERIKKRQSLSAIFTIVGYHHSTKTHPSAPYSVYERTLRCIIHKEKKKKKGRLVAVMLTVSWPIDRSRCCSNLRWMWVNN